MFKGLSGIKKAVKGGFSAVAEQTGQLAGQVYSDPTTSQGHLKETIKQKFSSAVESTEGAIESSENTVQARETAKEVAHKVKHYGAFGEDYLGYSDPTKELRKAVKKKEKEAKKARKAKKKKTGKKEDLFDPENLAKYKLELEEKKRERDAALLNASAIGQDRTGESNVSDKKDKPEQEEKEGSDKSSPSKEEPIKFTLDLAKPTSAESSAKGSAVTTPASVQKDTEDWQFFERLTSGVDNVIQKKKEELKELKQESYYQQKKTAVELEEEEKQTGKKPKKDKKKKWADLDTAEFEDHDGFVSTDEDDKNSSASEGPDVIEDEDKPQDKEDKEEDSLESDPNKPRGLVEIPDDPIDLDADEDIFNTEGIDAILSGDIKLAVIPDDPVYDDDEDDPFNTKFADEVVKTEKENKRKEASKLKFTGLSSVADVLSGKRDKVDKDLVDVAVKRKRRRANRINLIAEDQSDVTKVEDIGTIVPKSQEEEQCDILTSLDSGLAPVPVGDLLAATPSPVPPSPGVTEGKSNSGGQKFSTLLGLEDFEELDTKNTNEQLTSNVAILAGEFTKAAEEEADDFDAAFDALAQESATKYKLEELEKQFADDDVFDTSTVDKILNLVSLANKVETEEEPLETFEDKDPFDTSAYDDITCDLEADLGFESLAKRDPEDDQNIISVTVAEIDPFIDLSKGSDVFGGPPGITVAKAPDQGWAAFKEDKKPKRPPPPKPAPPRPSRPPPKSGNTLVPRSSVSVVVKAPSTESIKSWNCSVAENLITKSKLEALESSTLEEDEEEEFDPFDTTQFKDVGNISDKEDDIDDPFDTRDFKDVGNISDKEVDVEDPFDTSAVPDFKPAKEEVAQETPPEEKVDLLADIEEDKGLDATLIPVAKDVDPFDTDFASDILPNKGDPFDTSFVKGGPGKAELRALEEEFIDKEEFDPRTVEGTSIPRKQVAPGTAGRQRPSAGLKGLSDLEIKAPPLPQKPNTDIEEEEEEEDPFDTTIVNKVIPVRKAKQSTEISVEDVDFDPTSSFNAIQKEEIDPFDTSVATAVIPELRAQAEAEAKAKAEEEAKKAKERLEAKTKAIAEAAAKLASQVDEDKPLSSEPITKPIPHSLTDDDFDPRA